MDPYAAATSWIIFGAVVGFGCWYYYPSQPLKSQRNPEGAQSTATPRRKKNENEERGRPHKRPGSERSSGNAVPAADPLTGSGSLRKRKAPGEQPAAAPPALVQSTEPEDDMNTRKWAEGMVQTQKGHDITSTKSKDTRVKTVKQSNALHAPLQSSASSQAGADADDDLSPVVSPNVNSGDVSDMLEPARSGPPSLRVMPPSQPQKEKVPRAAKEEVIETKKQRQHRQRAEERRLQREAEESQRKKLEENQRRAAREARGEPARNGVPISKPPAVSAWVSSTASNGAPLVHDSHNTPLLDTFDAESMSSSNGGPGASTGHTSITSGGVAHFDHDLASEEEQMAQAMKQSGDESGWTTVAQPKKLKKKAETPSTEPQLANKTNLPAPSSSAIANGKPVGFQALEVEYEQRADADPNDASNWDA